MEFGRRLLSGDVVDEKQSDLAKLLRELLELGNGKIPTQKIIQKSKNSFARRVVEAGGLRYLNS
jgi:hypothetical protein